ncbi:hypothetical protein ACP6JC_002750 [Aspergillus fumigatus]
MPERSSYSSLFRSDSEITPFFVLYRWWEDEATTVLWAFDVQEIKRVIRYGLFRDPNLPRTSLQSRNATTIDTFLFSLLEPHERFLLSNLSHIQKVEEILRRSTNSSPPSVRWSWFPSQKDRDLDPRALARDIDGESHLHFKRISFEELVRYSLGYPAASVDWFLQQHTAFYIHLWNYFNAFPEEVARYTEVEKVGGLARVTRLQTLLTDALHSTSEVGAPSPIVPWFTVCSLCKVRPGWMCR